MVTNLKLKRISLGIKQKDLADRVGISPQYLMNIEKGKAKNPSTLIMKRLAEELQCNVQDLFFEDQSNHESVN